MINISCALRTGSLCESGGQAYYDVLTNLYLILILCVFYLTEFDTSKLEMNAVADMFDHDKLGLIDWKEFIAALRPDWEEKKPDTEAEKIHDEVKRLVMLCTCRQKFRVFQVGEGKYRVRGVYYEFLGILWFIALYSHNNNYRICDTFINVFRFDFAYIVR